jgi:hypothetical protein
MNQLSSITMPANVRISADAIDNGFAAFYDNNGKKAGTYIHVGGKWTYKR